MTDLKQQNDELREVLKSIHWKSADKDNMEFSALITYSQMIAIRKLLDQIEDLI